MRRALPSIVAVLAACSDGASGPRDAILPERSVARPAETVPAAGAVVRRRRGVTQAGAPTSGDVAGDPRPSVTLTADEERELTGLVDLHRRVTGDGAPYVGAGGAAGAWTPDAAGRRLSTARLLDLLAGLALPDTRLAAVVWELAERAHGEDGLLIAEAILRWVRGDDAAVRLRALEVLSRGILEAGGHAAALQGAIRARIRRGSADPAELGVLFEALGGLRGEGVNVRGDLLAAFDAARGSARAGVLEGLFHARHIASVGGASADRVFYGLWPAPTPVDRELIRVLETSLEDDDPAPRSAALRHVLEALLSLQRQHAEARGANDTVAAIEAQDATTRLDRALATRLASGVPLDERNAAIQTFQHVAPQSAETLALLLRACEDPEVADGALWAVVRAGHASELSLACIVRDAIGSGRGLGGAQIAAVRERGSAAASAAPVLLVSARAAESFWSSDAIAALHAVAPGYEPAFETYVAALSRPLTAARGNAITALGPFGERAVPHLVRMLADREPGISGVAQAALSVACPKPSESTAVWAALASVEGAARDRLRAWLAERVPGDPRLGD